MFFLCFHHTSMSDLEPGRNVMKQIGITLILSVLLLTASSSYAKTMAVLVQPFSNDGTAQYSWLSAGMTNTVISDLGSFSSIRVITESDRKQALNELALSQTGALDENSMKKIGKMLGADLILTGSYMVNVPKIRIFARIVNVETGSIEKTLKVDGTMDSIFDVQDKIVIGLMENAGSLRLEGVHSPLIDDAALQRLAAKQRPALSAFELYSKGLEVEYTDPSRAFDFFRQAISIDETYADALIQAGYISGSMYNRFDEGLGFLTRADDILAKRGETSDQHYADLMTYKGIVHAGKGSNAAALDCYVRARRIYDKLGILKTEGYSALLQNIGNVYQNLYDYDQALKYSLKAKEILDQIRRQNTNNYASILQCIGNVYQCKKEYDQALQYYTLSAKTYESLSLENTANAAMLSNNIGNIYYGKGNFDLAIENYSRAEKIYVKLSQQKTVIYGHLMFGFALAWNKKETGRRRWNISAKLFLHMRQPDI